MGLCLDPLRHFGGFWVRFKSVFGDKAGLVSLGDGLTRCRNSQ